MRKKSRKRCPVCTSNDVPAFFKLPRIPVYCNIQYPTREEAVSTPKRDIHLGFCKSCGHIFNLVFDPRALKYDERYENSLHYSPFFQQYAESLAKQLIDRYDLHQKRILELGCGKGEFLTMLCELGDNTGIGFDPSYMPERTEKAANSNITFIRDYYSARYADYKADFICSRHVLEHVQSPRDFLLNVRKTIGRQLNTIIFFEVPNGTFILHNSGIWDIIYEHCSYFSRSSITHLFRTCGCEIRELEEAFGGQFLCVEAFFAEKVSRSEVDFSPEVEAMSSDIAFFADKYMSQIAKWQRNLKAVGNARQKAVVWGAGSKGVTFLNALKLKEQIEFVIDVNPNKEGKYVPGTGQKIVSPSFLEVFRPDIVIVMNRNYAQEIETLLDSMDLRPDLMLA